MKASQISPQSGWVGILDGKEIAIFNDGQRRVVLENVCPHAGCQTT